MKTTKEQRERILKIFHGAAWNLEDGQFTLHGFFKEIDSLQSLVRRQAELLERAKHWVILAKAHEHWESLQEGTEPDYDAEDAFLKDLEALGEELNSTTGETK